MKTSNTVLIVLFIRNIKTRMHSSRMRTACSSSCSRVEGSTPPPPEQTHLDQAPPQEQIPPPGCGLGDPPLDRSPSTSPLGVGLETPPGQIPLNFPPPGCGPGNLQGMLGYHPPCEQNTDLESHPPTNLD